MTRNSILLRATGGVGALVLGAATVLAAGTGSVEGTVIDQLTNQVVPGGKIQVSIACGAVHKTASVDGNGHFTLAGLPEGNCTLTASGAAYATASRRAVAMSSARATSARRHRASCARAATTRPASASSIRALRAAMTSTPSRCASSKKRRR